MWSNAGLSTSVLITTCSPANGMVHHTVAKIFVSTKLRDLGPKTSAVRTFWRMVATCILYQPPTVHLLRNLTTFSLASVKTSCVGTGFLGLTYPFFPHKALDDTPEFPQIPPICFGNYIPGIGFKDVFMRALYTPLPPMGLLETVQLSLKEGQRLSESTIRRLRRRDAETRAAAAEGRAPLSEYQRRKQRKLATRASTPQTMPGQWSEKEQLREPVLTRATGAHSPSKNSPGKQGVQVVEMASARPTTDNQGIRDTVPASQMMERFQRPEDGSTFVVVPRSLGIIDAQ